MNDHDSNDLYSLLINSKQFPEGRYNHQTWELDAHGQFDSQEAQVASMHEAMHHVLNNSTLFGLLLVVTAYLAREKDEFKAHLSELVNNSRNAHEAFATYSSLLLASPDIANEDWMLKRYHQIYGRYVAEAKQIINGIDAPHLQYVSLNSVMRLCFQSGELAAVIKQKKPFDIPLEEYPDNRMQYLQESLTPSYWRSIESGYLKLCKKDKIVSMFMTADGRKKVEDKYGVTALNNVTVKYQGYIYSKIAAEILLPQYATVRENAHLEYFPELLKFAEQVVGKKPSVGSQKLESQPARDFGLSEFENEALRFRTNGLPVRVLSFSDLPVDEWENLQFNYEGLKHIYIVSRMTEKFIQQFQFNQDDQKWLVQNHPYFITAIISRIKIEGKVRVLAVVLDEASQIDALSHKKMLILSSSSLKLCAEDAWQKWHNSLQKNSTHTALFDLKPSVYLDSLAEQYKIIEYAKFYLEIETVNYPFICLIAKGGLSTGIFFIPCSEVLTNILLEYLNAQTYSQTYNENDPLNEEFNLVLRFSMSHLVDESVFDFRLPNT